MSDAYGDLPLPVPAPLATEAASDPILDTLLLFFRAVLNAKAGAAWTAIAPGTGELVKFTFTHNPAEAAFKQAATPALYLWRDTVFKARQIAHDWRIRPSRLMLRWVPFPVYQQERQRRWDPFFNAIPAVLDAAIERGRDPAWIVPSDVDPVSPTFDPKAAEFGSLLWNHITVHKLEIAREDVKRGEIVIPMENDREVVIDALEVPIELEERLLRDPFLNDELALVEVTTETADDPPLTTITAQFPYDPD